MIVNPLPTLNGTSPSSFGVTFVEIPSSKAAYSSNEGASFALEAIAFAWASLTSTRETSSFSAVVVIATAVTAFIASIADLVGESQLQVKQEQRAAAKLED